VERERALKKIQDITHLETSVVGAEEAESVVDEEDLEHRSTIVKDKTTRRSSSMASSKHHEPPPKNQSDRENRSKDRHLIVKKRLITSTRNMHTGMTTWHVQRNFDWERGSRLLLRSLRRTNGTPRAFMEEWLETLTRTARRDFKGVSNHPKPQVRLDKSYSTGYKDVESDVECMPHLINSDDEIYTGDPVNEDRARERTTFRTTYRMKHILQAYWDLPEMTLQQAVRMPMKGRTNQRDQEKRQELAGPQLMNKASVEVTFDEIAGAYSEEEDPRSVFGPTKHGQSDHKARVYVTHEGFSDMPWPIRMHWCNVAILDILHQGDTLQSMGTKEIVVGHGQHDDLVSTAYGKILQTQADEYIDWYALAIKKAWEDRPNPVRTKELRALETLLHCSTQQLIRMAASRGGILKLDDGFDGCVHQLSPRSTRIRSFRVTTIPSRRVRRENMENYISGNFTMTTGEIVVENIMAKGERHELPLALKRDATSLAMDSDGDQGATNGRP
jgi:hypothetical protein